MIEPDRGWELSLPGGATQTLLPGASLGLVGVGAAVTADAFAAATDAALLLPDHADPLHAGLAIADQIAAALSGTRRAALDRATDLLELAGVPEPHHRVRARPHQLSELDRQRAQLALVLAREPALIVASDPTAGLGQTEAGAFAALLGRLRGRLGFTLIVSAEQPEPVERLVDEFVVLGEDGVVERRRRRPGSQPSSSSSSST
jgi:ABC-type glutathione transport system ATPase component